MASEATRRTTHACKGDRTWRERLGFREELEEEFTRRRERGREEKTRQEASGQGERRGAVRKGARDALMTRSHGTPYRSFIHLARRGRRWLMLLCSARGTGGGGAGRGRWSGRRGKHLRKSKRKECSRPLCRPTRTWKPPTRTQRTKRAKKRRISSHTAHKRHKCALDPKRAKVEEGGREEEGRRRVEASREQRATTTLGAGKNNTETTQTTQKQCRNSTKTTQKHRKKQYGTMHQTNSNGDGNGNGNGQSVCSKGASGSEQLHRWERTRRALRRAWVPPGWLRLVLALPLLPFPRSLVALLAVHWPEPLGPARWSGPLACRGPFVR